MRAFPIIVVAAAIGLGGAAPVPQAISAGKAGPVLMDGACADASWKAAQAHALGHGAAARFLADRDFLYVCVDAPADSYANVDLYLRHGGRLYNLHASAQLGERVRAEAGWPDFQWWNHQGWAANWLPFRGMRRDGETARAQFGFPAGREFQIARARFPGDRLELMVHVHELATPDGLTGEGRFPAAAKEDDPGSWVTLRLG